MNKKEHKELKTEMKYLFSPLFPLRFLMLIIISNIMILSLIYIVPKWSLTKKSWNQVLKPYVDNLFNLLFPKWLRVKTFD